MITKLVDSIILKVLLLLMMASSGLLASDYTSQEMIDISNDCLDCHDEMGESLSGSAHQITSSDSKVPLKTGCIGCHDGWAEHMDDPSPDNIGQPQNYSLSRQSDVCAGCHQTSHQNSMINSDPHGQAGVTCLTCHSIHDNPIEKLLTADKQEFCITCHPGISAEFKQRSAHPFQSENIFCTDCHSMDGIEKGLLSGGINTTCQKCHYDYAGPSLYEHPVSFNHLIDGGGCVECHQPHGSANERLLNQPGQAICLQCHGIPPAHITAHGGFGNSQSCLNCHTEIHGSYDNSKFLDPNFGDLLGGDCTKSGCHILGE